MNKGYLKEKLGNYQVDPPEGVWHAISDQLNNGRKRRGMYIIILATAASIALAISLGIYFFGPDLPREYSGVEEPPVMEEGLSEQSSPERITKEGKDTELSESSQVLAHSETAGAQEERSEGLVPDPMDAAVHAEASEAVDLASEAESGDVDPVTEDAAVTEDFAVSEDQQADLQSDPEPDTTLELIEDLYPDLEPEKKKKSSWMVGAAVSPLYSYRNAEAAAIPSDQAESGLLSYSTGVHVRYRRNSRFAIETGIYYNRTGIAIGAPEIRIFSQRLDNVVFGMGSESADINTVNNSVGNIVAYSGDIYLNGYKINNESGIDALQSVVLSDVQVAEYGIQQHLDFLELPFNLRYSVIDRAFELQVVGGVSTNFLVGNSVTMEGPSGREEIGYLTNVNTVNYSGNAGLGMIYHMGRKMSLFLEPRFRYFINSVNDETLPATRPYSLGFYTGLSYTF
jgi:hypothetical protein